MERRGYQVLQKEKPGEGDSRSHRQILLARCQDHRSSDLLEESEKRRRLFRLVVVVVLLGDIWPVKPPRHEDPRHYPKKL